MHDGTKTLLFFLKFMTVPPMVTCLLFDATRQSLSLKVRAHGFSADAGIYLRLFSVFLKVKRHTYYRDTLVTPGKSKDKVGYL